MMRSTATNKTTTSMTCMTHDQKSRLYFGQHTNKTNQKQKQNIKHTNKHTHKNKEVSRE